MLSLLMLVAPPALAPDPETAIDAERAFNRAAQTEGQWTAFRRFSTDDALIFTPQPAKAHEALPQKDPKLTIQWWPAESYVSCDGSVAVNTGPWVSARGVGYFTTVWVRQSDGHYKWVYDGGDTLAVPRPLPEKPKVRTARCHGAGAPAADDPISAIEAGPPSYGYGQAHDGSLAWHWTVQANGARTFVVELWEGNRYVAVLTNEIAAPK